MEGGQPEQVREALRLRASVSLEGQKRSSVALLLRRAPASPVGGWHLEVLFIKRASRSRDIFSGDVALPGGKREAGETDLQAAVRETLEEVGLDLEQAGAWECLGRLDDRPLLNLVVCCFVFFQLLESTPALTLQPSEVAGCGWVPLEYLCQPLGEICIPRRWPRARFDREAGSGRCMRLLTALQLPWLLGLHEMCFNSIDLPVELAEVTHTTQDPILKSTGVFRLWGFTLHLVGDFLVVARLRDARSAFAVFPPCQVLGLRLQECVHPSRWQNLAYNAVKLAARRLLGLPLGLGQASRWLLYLEASAGLAAPALLVLLWWMVRRVGRRRIISMAR